MDPKRVYLDNNATTQVAPEVLDAMRPYFEQLYGNGSSLHQSGRAAAQAISQARTQIAACLHTDRDDIAFTSGGTESDNWAIRGTLAAQPEKRHIATSAVEHLAVLTCCQVLEKQGYSVTYLRVDEQGNLDLDELADAIRTDTAIVSIMQANNETGVIFPIDQIAQIVHEKGSLLHVDAVQAFGKIPIDVSAVPVDLMSLSAHKIHGPKGIGALYIRTDTPIVPLLYGGSQERGFRPGTENVPGAVGFGTAVALASGAMGAHAAHMQNLRDHFETEVLRRFPPASINGDPVNRLPNTSSISFEGRDAQTLLAKLDRHGIAASGGSACCAQTKRLSHVLEAMGIPAKRAEGAVRFGVSRFTSRQDIDHALDVLDHILKNEGPPQKTGRQAEPSMPLAVTETTMSSTERRSEKGGREEKVYAIGRVDHDFGTESRRDSFAQLMAGDSPDPDDHTQLLAHHEKNPAHADAHIWTLTHGDVPIYAMRPEGHFAREIYARLRTFIAGQQKSEADGRIGFVAVPGIIVGNRRLRNGHIVPLIQPDPRGMVGLSKSALIQTVQDGVEAGRGSPLAPEETAGLTDMVNAFFHRVTHDFRNLGTAPQDRALNFLIAHVHHLADVFVHSNADRRLADIGVEESPICRLDSDCWDIQLTFFSPSNRQGQARRVHRLKIDVGDVIPVALGKMRYWDVY